VISHDMHEPKRNVPRNRFRNSPSGGIERCRRAVDTNDDRLAFSG
jgi:hypothetical protein